MPGKGRTVDPVSVEPIPGVLGVRLTKKYNSGTD